MSCQLFMGWWNHTLTYLTKLLQVFLPTQSSGRYNRWLVRDTCEGVALRLQGTFSVLIWSIYVELGRHTKNKYIYVAHNSVTNSNIE
jgi:hypothetical protein